MRQKYVVQWRNPGTVLGFEPPPPLVFRKYCEELNCLQLTERQKWTYFNVNFRNFSGGITTNHHPFWVEL